MTTPTTEWLNKAGSLIAAAKALDAIMPSGDAGVALGHSKVRTWIGNGLDAYAEFYDVSRSGLDEMIAESTGYTQTGGTGAICA